MAWPVWRYRPGGDLRSDGCRRRAVLTTLPLNAPRRLVLGCREEACTCTRLDGDRVIEILSTGDAPAGG